MNFLCGSEDRYGGTVPEKWKLRETYISTWMNKPDILLCNLWQNYCISLRIDGCGRVAVHVRLLIFLEERGWEKGMIRLAYHRNESNRLSKDHGYPPQMNKGYGGGTMIYWFFCTGLLPPGLLPIWRTVRFLINRPVLSEGRDMVVSLRPVVRTIGKPRPIQFPSGICLNAGSLSIRPALIKTAICLRTPI